MNMDRNRYSRLASLRIVSFFADYGMLLVLVLLCVLFSILTLRKQDPVGAQAAKSVYAQVTARSIGSQPLDILATNSKDDSAFVDVLSRLIISHGGKTVVHAGDPATIRSSLETVAASDSSKHVLLTTQAFAPVVENIRSQIPQLSSSRIIVPESYRWPTFLLADNLRNVANQITVIAIIAIGMTMVIITAGIDLSVGSLIALSAVVLAWVVGKLGGADVSSAGVLLAVLAALLVCGLTGAFSGLMITAFRIPPFIATLAMMQVAAGIAYIISEGRPIYQLPEGFVWLGRGVDPVFAIPIAVILMLVLYIIAHILMSRTTLGRYIYAVGGNSEAARLAGIRVKYILGFVYTMSGILAGLGGVLMASQLKSGAPTYGLSYELYVIAAVVVGGTSLSGGEGRIFGTLIGALIIGVIQNGMNLTNVETYTQKVVLGLVILAAVLLDRLKQRGFTRRKMTVPAVHKDEVEIHSHS